MFLPVRMSQTNCWIYYEDVPTSAATPKLEFVSTEDDEDEGIYHTDTASVPSEVVLDEEMLRQPEKKLSFMARMNNLYDSHRSSDALKVLENEFFDGIKHQALNNPIVKMANREGVTPEAIAAIFNNVVYDVVSDETASVPVPRLEQLRIMVHSMRQQYPNAGNYDRTTSEIDEQLLRS